MIAAPKLAVSTAEPRLPVVHELKTWPQYFREVLEGTKPFEVRKTDRDFRVGDLLLLREWDPQARNHVGGYTGGFLFRRVTYLLHLDRSAVLGHRDCPICVMAIEPLPDAEW